ncbi:arylesterase [Aliikangiella coralliicola]|uniref:Arylesterase n=1 Tax=Aliikangiella coralliicola TaxID=2592383 RepID=A0A545UF68_9GAMM|nr:arylesterase [Aliikangiella coralliicola]TQV88108.1 arylesterase [Aliikangiella coralliicola]
MKIRRLKACTIYLLVIFLASCGSDKLEPLNSNDTILAFGDSLTFGVGAEKNQSYPNALELLTGLSVINAGISGETTSEGVKRFQAELNKHSPKLVVLLEGGNDILRNHNKTITKKNLASMIEMASVYGAKVVLIGVPEKKLFSNSAPFYAELADQYNLAFDDDILADLLRSSEYKSDPIHLNSAGYQKLAEGIYQLLRDNGALQ